MSSYYNNKLVTFRSLDYGYSGEGVAYSYLDRIVIVRLTKPIMYNHGSSHDGWRPDPGQKHNAKHWPHGGYYVETELITSCRDVPAGFIP